MRFWRFATATEQTAIVFVPDLDPEAVDDLSPLPALKRFFATKSYEHRSDDGYAGQWLVDVPISPAPLWQALGGKVDPSSFYLNVSFLSLQPDLNAVWARPWDQRASDAHVALAKQLLGDAGLVLNQAHDNALFIVLDQAPEVCFHPLWALTGTSLDRLMPQGREAKPWIQLISESQILFHHHQRDDSHQLSSPDGLWFWGMGRLPPVNTLQPKISCVYARAKELQGLARHLGLVGGGLHGKTIEDLQPGHLIEFVAESGASNDPIRQLDWHLRRLLRRVWAGRLPRVALATRHHRWTVTTRDLWRGVFGR